MDSEITQKTFLSYDYEYSKLKNPCIIAIGGAVDTLYSHGYYFYYTDLSETKFWLGILLKTEAKGVYEANINKNWTL